MCTFSLWHCVERPSAKVPTQLHNRRNNPQLTSRRFKLHAVSSREDWQHWWSDERNIRDTHQTRKTVGEVGRLGTKRCRGTLRRETHIRLQTNKPDFASWNWDRLSLCLKCLPRPQKDFASPVRFGWLPKKLSWPFTDKRISLSSENITLTACLHQELMSTCCPSHHSIQHFLNCGAIGS